MFDELLNILNTNNDYINDYLILKIDDFFNENIINFYYIILKYILKYSIYIYHIPILFKTKKLIINLSKSNKAIFNTNKNINEKLEYIFLALCDSEYYLDIIKLKNALMKYKDELQKFKIENIKNVEFIIIIKNKENYKKDLNDYDKYEIMNKEESIIKITYKKENIIKNEELNKYIDKWTEYMINDKEINNLHREDKLILIDYFSKNYNNNNLINLFTWEQYLNFKDYNIDNKIKEINQENSSGIKNLEQNIYNDKYISKSSKETKEQYSDKKGSTINSKNNFENSQINNIENNKKKENINEIIDENYDFQLSYFGGQSKIEEEKVQKELPTDPSLNNQIFNNSDFSIDFQYYETDIKNILQKSIYSIIVNEKEEISQNNEENDDNKKIDNIYETLKNNNIIYSDNNKKNQIKLKDNFMQLINYINKIKELIKNETKNNFKLNIELHFEEGKQKKNSKFKNINCLYKIKTTITNVFEKIKKDEDILNNSNLNTFKKLYLDCSFSLSSISKNSKYKSDLESLKRISDNMEVASYYKIIEFSKTIGVHEDSANYIKELNNGALISGGPNDLIYYKNLNFDPIPMKQKNHSIFEMKTEKNIIKIGVCSCEVDSSILSINSTTYNSNFTPFNIKARICLEVFNNYYFCNEKGLLRVNNIKSNIIQNKEINITKDSFWNGIIIDYNIFALTSNKVLIKGKDQITFYNNKSNKFFSEINNYSFNLSQNNLTLIKTAKITSENKLILCACKKYMRGQKNGILLVKLNIDKCDIDKKFYNTNNFEVYCFCHIFKFYNINDYHVINTKNNKMVDTNYFFVGGFDIKRRKGLIKLFQINYDNENFEKIKIEYLQNIEIQKYNNEDSKNFKGFRGPITCITQSKTNGKIFVTCFDGKVHKFTFPNIF